MASQAPGPPLPASNPGQELPLQFSEAEMWTKLNAFSFPPKEPNHGGSSAGSSDYGGTSAQTAHSATALVQSPSPGAGSDNVLTSAQTDNSTAASTQSSPGASSPNVPDSTQTSSTCPTQFSTQRSGPKHIIVLGAGIIGLQTALSILSSEETKHFKVTIIAEHTPSDRDPAYTSPLGGGNWRSHVGKAVYTGLAASAADLRTIKLQNFDLDTFIYWNKLCDSWTEGIIDNARLDRIPPGWAREYVSEDQKRKYHLAREKMEGRCGLGWRMARHYWGRDTAETTYKDGSWIWWLRPVGACTLDPAHEYLKLRPEGSAEGPYVERRFEGLYLQTPRIDYWEHWPDHAIWGISYRSICFDPDKYLKWVMHQVKKKGGKIIKTKVATENGLEGVVREVKTILLDKLSQGENAEYYEPAEGDFSSDEEPEKTSNHLKRLSSASAKSIKKILSRGSCKSSDNGSRRTSSGIQTTDQNLLSEGLVGDPKIVAIVNCTGGSARHFVSDEEKSMMYPIRGQIILVKGSAVQCRTYVGYPGAADEEMLYVIPRPGTNTTVLGGCKQVKSWDNELEIEADEDMNKRIIEGIKRFKLAEDLRTGPDREFEIIDEYDDGSKRCSVGFHPGRADGPRVGIERGNGGKVDGTYVLHNYGHDGAGYQSSVGCAEKIRKLIMELE